MVLPQANISLGALDKMPNRNLKIEQNSWKTRGLCMATCLWNHQRQLLTSTPWTEFAGWHHNHWSWTYNGFFDPISSFASIQFWWYSVSSISCHHRIQWYIWHIWAPILHCVAFRHFPDLTVKQLCLDPSFAFLHTLSPHDTIFTKHQAFVPSFPMLLTIKCRFVRLEFCFNASARAWQGTNGLRNTMKHTAHIRMLHCFHTFWRAFPLVLIAQLQHPTAFHYLIVKNMRNLPVVLPIPISKCWFQAARTHETIKSPWVIKGTLHCQFATLCTFNEALVWGILELEFWTHQQIVANIWLFLWPGHPMVLPQANISLGALEKMPNRNLKIEQNSWKTRGLCMATCLWNHQRQLLTSTPWTEFAGWHHNHWSWTYNGFFDPISSFASIQFWWFSVSSISCHHRLQWYIWHIWVIWAPILHCVAFRHFPDLTVKQLCLDPPFAFLHTLSPHDTIFTKHQAFVPSSPMLL